MQDESVRRRVVARSSDGVPGSMPREVFESLEKKGRHVVFTKEMTGWYAAHVGPDRIVFRPGWEAGRSLVGYGALAAGLSLVFYVGGAWGAVHHYVLHVALWLVAVSWPLSILYQRLELRKDAANGIVHVRGQGIVFPYGRRFPVGGVGLTLLRSERCTSVGRYSSRHTGHDWKLMILGHQPLALTLGHTPGVTAPRKPPLEVRRLLGAFCEMFEVPVEMGFPVEESGCGGLVEDNEDHV